MGETLASRAVLLANGLSTESQLSGCSSQGHEETQGHFIWSSGSAQSLSSFPGKAIINGLTVAQRSSVQGPSGVERSFRKPK